MISSSPRREALTEGDLIPFTPRFIDRRDTVEEADGGGVNLRLVVSRADQQRFGGAKRIDLFQTDDDPPFELHQQLVLTVVGFETEDWGKWGATRILKAVADPIPFEPKFHTRVDGIPSVDCQSLEKRFGHDFPEVIAEPILQGLVNSSPCAIANAIAASVETAASPLSKTNFSKQKKITIITACLSEIEDAKEETKASASSERFSPEGEKENRERCEAVKKLITLFTACHIGKRKARYLAAGFDETKSPYQHFFAGRMSFLEADRFAHLFDSARAVKDRGLAITINHFLGTGSIIFGAREIVLSIWKDFGVQAFRRRPL